VIQSSKGPDFVPLYITAHFMQDGGLVRRDVLNHVMTDNR
jgi:hypothetical protein